MHVATNDDLQLNIENMKRYTTGLATLKKIFLMLQDEMDRGFRTIYLEVMEARVCFNKDDIKQYGDTIVKYQSW